MPDLPVEESAAAGRRFAQRRDVSLIQLVTPTTPRERAVRIAETSTGFLYYVSVAGITGERTQLPPELVDNVGWLRTQTDLPICIGFGISQPEHVKLLAPVADGLIVGSAIVRRIATAAEQPRDKVLREVGDYVAELLAALTYSRAVVERRANSPAFGSTRTAHSSLLIRLAGGVGSTSKSIHFIARRNGSMRSITSPF